MRWRAAAMLALSVTLSACSTRPATQIVVEVDAEPGVRAQLDVVHVVVNGGDGETTGAPRVQRLDVRQRPPRWPFTVVVAPLDRDPERRYEIVVAAEGAVPAGGADRPVVATVRAISGFVPGETRVLRLVLEDACRDVTCGAEETCRAGTCGPADVDPTLLPMPGIEIDAGVATSIDAFVSRDTANEPDSASVADATIDAPRVGDVGALADAGVASPIVQIAASSTASGGGHFCALREDGSAWCWGRNDQGQLGDGTRDAHSRPVRVLDLPAVEELALGARHSCARTSSGVVYCWGSNTDRQLGAGDVSVTGVPRPVAVEGVAGATRISGGYGFSCAVLADGGVWCWGSSTSGELGLATGTALPARRLDGLADVRDIALGAYHGCALTNAGSVFCWGDGALGDGSDDDHPEPGQVADLTGVTQIASGPTTSCAVSGDEVWCWGTNAAHPTGAYVPLPARALTGAADIAMGAAGCAIRTDRRLACWGRWIGDGTPDLRLVPASLGAPVDVLEIAANGANAVCARTGDSIWCWGQNANGEVGDGTTEERPSPVMLRW